MRRLITIAAAAASIAGGAELGGSAQAASIPNASLGLAANAVLPLEKVQYYWGATIIAGTAMAGGDPAGTGTAIHGVTAGAGVAAGVGTAGVEAMAGAAAGAVVAGMAVAAAGMAVVAAGTAGEIVANGLANSLY
jgi:hypothetical protein